MTDQADQDGIDYSRRRFIGATAEPAPVVRRLSHWNRVNLPQVSQQGVFWAAVSTEGPHCYIAGDDGIVFHFDGDAWQQENAATKLPIHALSVAGPSHLIAVGWMGVICERRDGAWKHIQGGTTPGNVASADVVRQNLPLFATLTDTSGDVWAVGDVGRVVCMQEGVWNEREVDCRANLRCLIQLKDSTVLAGGADGVVLAFNNGQMNRWDINSSCHIAGFVEVPDGGLYAIGSLYDAEAQGFIGSLFRRVNESWQDVSQGEQLPRLRSILSRDNLLVLTGDNGAIYLFDSGQFRKWPTQVRHDLHAILPLHDGGILVCGDGGTILKENTAQEPPEIEGSHPKGQQAIEENSPWMELPHDLSDKTLRGIWAASAQQVFAVGDAGTILHGDCNRWRLMNCPVNVRLHAIWGTSPTNIYAIGDAGTILHYDGSAWAVDFTSGIDAALLAITGFGPHDVIAVGDQGCILRYDGVTWERESSGIQSELYSVWGLDSSHILAVGGAGTVLRWNGECWSVFHAGTENELYGVSGTALDKISLVGLSGTSIRFNGQAWIREFSGVRNDLHAVAVISGQSGFAVGSRGTVLCWENDHWELEAFPLEVGLRSVTIAGGTAWAAGDGGVIFQRNAV